MYTHREKVQWQSNATLRPRRCIKTTDRLYTPYIWAWGHFALPKRPLKMGMGTLCIAKKAPKYGHGDTLHRREGQEVAGQQSASLKFHPQPQFTGTILIFTDNQRFLPPSENVSSREPILGPQNLCKHASFPQT